MTNMPLTTEPQSTMAQIEDLSKATKSSPSLQQISIVVACRNELDHIRTFIDSLRSLDLSNFDWEIILADGLSNDGTTSALSAFARGNPRIKVLANPSRIVASGLNMAISAARGDIILRMDAHTEYAPDYVNKCIETLEKTQADNVGGPARTKAEGLQARAIQAAYHSRFSTGGARFHDDRFSGYVDTVPYGCWHKETLEQLGLFDERLVRNQDDELNLRLIRAGGTIWQSSEIVSWYRTRTTLPLLFRQYFQYGFWKVPVIRKHTTPASWRHFMPITFVLTNLFVLLISLGAAVCGFRSLMWGAMFSGGLLMGGYAVTCVAAACFSARRFGWQLLPFLPITFAVFHFSYGLGFLLGLVYWPFARSSGSRLGNLFEGVTR